VIYMFVCIGPNTKFSKMLVKIWESRMIKDDQGWSRMAYMFIIFTLFIVSCHLFLTKFAELFSESKWFSDFLMKAIKVERRLSKSADFCRNWLTLPRNCGRVMLRLRELWLQQLLIGALVAIFAHVGFLVSHWNSSECTCSWKRCWLR